MGGARCDCGNGVGATVAVGLEPDEPPRLLVFQDDGAVLPVAHHNGPGALGNHHGHGDVGSRHHVRCAHVGGNEALVGGPLAGPLFDFTNALGRQAEGVGAHDPGDEQVFLERLEHGPDGHDLRRVVVSATQRGLDVDVAFGRQEVVKSVLLLLASRLLAHCP